MISAIKQSLAASTMILATATIALAVCCPAIDFSHGTLDWDGLRESCSDIEASDATKLSLEDLTVFRIAPDRYAFVHASVGCLESPFQADALYLTSNNNLEPALLASSDIANITVSWNADDIVIFFGRIRPIEQP